MAILHRLPAGAQVAYLAVRPHDAVVDAAPRPAAPGGLQQGGQ
jgi:hypothetical protein